MYKLKDKDIKKIIKIFAIVVISIFLLLLMIPILLTNNKIQNALVGEATKQLSKKLNTKVEIGKVNYEFFNTFDLENLYVQDLQKDTLLYVEHTHLNFDFWKIFSKKIVFKSAGFEKLNANLILDKDGKSNFQFIIDAFKSNKKTKSGFNYELNIQKIKITNSTFGFKNLAHSAQKDTSLIDFNRIKLNDIDGLFKVNYFKNDSLQAAVESLSFIEKSGFKLNNLSLAFRGFKKGFFSSQVALKLPNTKLIIDSVSIKYDSISYLKDFSHKVIVAAKINPSSVYLKDFQTFFHNLKNIDKPVNIKGELKGLVSSFTLKNFDLDYGNAIHLTTDANLNGIQDINETFIYADINKFQVEKNVAQDLLAKLSGRPILLPVELSRLGKVNYKGNISGFFNNLVAYGNINTNLGSLNTDILLQFANNLKDLRYDGTLRSSSFDLGRMLAMKELGKTAFNVSTKGSKLYNRPFVGDIDGDVKNIVFKDYNYENVSINGNYNGSGFNGNVVVDDANLGMDFNGEVKLEKNQLPVFNFDIALEHANINALHLTQKYENSNLSFTGNTNMVGNSLDNLNGFLELNNVSFQNKGKQLDINQLLFESKVDNNNSRFTVSSDIANGIFEGSFKYSTIPQTINAFLSDYLPALSLNSNSNYTNNYVNIDLNLPDTKKLSDVLELPFTLNGNTTVKGYVDDLNHHVKLNLISPYLSFGASEIYNINVDVNNEDNKLNVLGSAGMNVKSDFVNFNIKASAQNDSVYSQLAWHNANSIVYAGEIQAIGKLKKEGDFTTANINILPTQVVISDSIWNMNPSSIKLNADSTLAVNGFKFQHDNQFIKINGLISKKDDELDVNLNDLELGYIIGLFNLPDISFGGRATGTAKVSSVLTAPRYDADLYVKQALFNNALIGDGHVHSRWNVENKEMEAGGTFFNEKKDTVLIASGVYVPKADSLDFTFDARKANLGFLQQYLSAVVSNVQGVGTGKVRMYGKAKHIVFSGNAFAENASFMVDYLKTTYSFSDTVYLKPKSITFNDITLYDKDKNEAKLNGNLTHDGSFKDMKFDAYVRTKNLMALNTKSSDNDLFYGKAYAGGVIHLYGDEQNIHFDINVSSQPNTKFYLSIGSAETANENNFITFVNNDKILIDSDTLTTKIKEKTEANIFLDMELDVNENAEIQIVIDPKSGDNLTAVGSGNLRLTYDPNNELRLYGGYTIDKGSYLFTLQNFISKSFKLQPQSSIRWSGDPLYAKLDISAIYTQTASLKDLNDDVLLASTSRTNVPVNVVLKITDDMMNPNIKFDLDLPSSDEALKYQLKNIVNTQQMLNLQVGYLLLAGKFYTPEYTKTADYGNNLISSTLTPFLNTTLFGQLNNAISQITGGNFTFGLNARDLGNRVVQSSEEYEGNVYIQPNNRLIINGNVGYRNLDKKMFGDFDIEYLLTTNGKLMAKFYNHSRDVYTLRSEEYVQGLGLMYKESFDGWDALLKQLWNKTKTKKNDSTTIKNDTVK